MGLTRGQKSGFTRRIRKWVELREELDQSCDEIAKLLGDLTPDTDEERIAEGLALLECRHADRGFSNRYFAMATIGRDNREKRRFKTRRWDMDPVKVLDWGPKGPPKWKRELTLEERAIVKPIEGG